MEASRRSCVLIVLLATSCAPTRDAVRLRVMEELGTLAGNGARDCGAIELDASRDDAVACAAQAAAAGQAYHVAFQQQGIDSIIWEGASRDGSGKLWAVRYDSDVRGGAGWPPKPRLIVASCREVSFSAHDDPVVSCVEPVVQP